MVESLLSQIWDEFSEHKNKIKTLTEYYVVIEEFLNNNTHLLEGTSYTSTYFELGNPNDYTYGKLTVHLEDGSGKPYEKYEINLNFDERYWGYCECQPDSPNYNQEHKCCGDGCDYTFPAIEVYKVEHKGRDTYEGSANSLWKKVDDVLKRQSDYYEEVKRQEKEQRKQRLQERMKEIQNELAALED